MATTHFKGQPIKTAGDLPALGKTAPDFILTKTDLSESRLSDYKGQNVVLNIFPSLDTPVCAASVRKFNEQASSLPNAAVLCISADLPFAHKRFCEVEGINNVVMLSTFHHPEFGKEYGVVLIEGPLSGLMSRAVILIDSNGNVFYTQQVSEITQEPDYESVIEQLKKIV